MSNLVVLREKKPRRPRSNATGILSDRVSMNVRVKDSVRVCGPAKGNASGTTIGLNASTSYGTLEDGSAIESTE